jgi:hypothetical protein
MKTKLNLASCEAQIQQTEMFAGLKTSVNTDKKFLIQKIRKIFCPFYLQET